MLEQEVPTPLKGVIEVGHVYFRPSHPLERPKVELILNDLPKSGAETTRTLQYARTLIKGSLELPPGFGVRWCSGAFG